MDLPIKGPKVATQKRSAGVDRFPIYHETQENSSQLFSAMRKLDFSVLLKILYMEKNQDREHINH